MFAQKKKKEKKRKKKKFEVFFFKTYPKVLEHFLIWAFGLFLRCIARLVLTLLFHEYCCQCCFMNSDAGVSKPGNGVNVRSKH